MQGTPAVAIALFVFAMVSVDGVEGVVLSAAIAD
jgi:hypothetical protein